jgi:hypothetical protein
LQWLVINRPEKYEGDAVSLSVLICLDGGNVGEYHHQTYLDVRNRLNPVYGN